VIESATLWQVAGVVVPALASLGGAWGGLWLAIGKHKKERAFERSLDWYERMFRAMESATQSIDGALQYEEHGLDALADEVWGVIEGQFETINSLAGERDMHASQAAFDAIGECILSLSATVDQHAAKARSNPKGARSAAAAKSQWLLRGTTRVLADEVRRHLGRKPLLRTNDDRRLLDMGGRRA
jgi:hypothetical protein